MLTPITCTCFFFFFWQDLVTDFERMPSELFLIDVVVSTLFRVDVETLLYVPEMVPVHLEELLLLAYLFSDRHHLCLDMQVCRRHLYDVLQV